MEHYKHYIFQAITLYRKIITGCSQPGNSGKIQLFDIKKSIHSLYGAQEYLIDVYFNITDNQDGKTLNITIDEGKTNNINVGMRLNTRNCRFDCIERNS